MTIIKSSAHDDNQFLGADKREREEGEEEKLC